MMANTRIPYASAFLQTEEMVHVGTPEEGELIMIQAPDDDPSKLEDFIMEDAGIPLNMRL